MKQRLQKVVPVSAPDTRTQLSARLQTEQGFEVVGAPAGLMVFDVQARLGGLFLFEQIQGDAPQDGEVLGLVAYADAAIVFVEGHIDHPATAVFDRPMGSDLTVELGGTQLKTADVVALHARYGMPTCESNKAES